MVNTGSAGNPLAATKNPGDKPCQTLKTAHRFEQDQHVDSGFTDEDRISHDYVQSQLDHWPFRAAVLMSSIGVACRIKRLESTFARDNWPEIPRAGPGGPTGVFPRSPALGQTRAPKAGPGGRGPSAVVMRTLPAVPFTPKRLRADASGVWPQGFPAGGGAHGIPEVGRLGRPSASRQPRPQKPLLAAGTTERARCAPLIPRCTLLSLFLVLDRG